MASFPACYFALISKESIVLLKYRISFQLVKNNIFFSMWCKGRRGSPPPIHILYSNSFLYPHLSLTDPDVFTLV